jgi:hypothetical protein
MNCRKEDKRMASDPFLRPPFPVPLFSSTKDYEFDLIYLNGDNDLENVKTPDDTWKVRLIEENFHQLMFDVDDV